MRGMSDYASSDAILGVEPSQFQTCPSSYPTSLRTRGYCKESGVFEGLGAKQNYDMEYYW